MEVVLDALGFAAKGLVVFVTVVLTVLVVLALTRRGKGETEASIEVKRLDQRLRRFARALQHELLDKKAFKKLLKNEAKRAKEQGERGRVFVLDFEGDIAASAVDPLREEVSTLCQVAEEGDEVVVRLESTGGAVHGYGLAASQLARLRAKGLTLTVCVDKVAASGGYMMAAMADRIIAARFAIVGSIGVIAPVPNLHRFLQTHQIDYDEMTAGEYKRTVSMLAEITDKGREKFQSQLEETHDLFKDFIQEYRPALSLDEVATGEYWHGTRAKALGLVDELMTSDDYLLGKLDEAELYGITYEEPKTLRDRLVGAAAHGAERSLLKLWTRLDEKRFV